MNIKFKKTLSLIMAILMIFSLLFSLSSCTTNKTNSENTGKNSNYVSIDAEINNISIEDEQAVINALQEISESLGIEDAEKELKISSVNEVGKEKYYRVQQYYKDIPVYGNNVVLGVDENGKAFSVTSNTALIEDVDTTPKIALEDAKNEVEKFFEEQKPEQTSFYSPNELVIYQQDDGENILAYDIVITFSADNSEQRTYECFVSAYTGDVVKVLRMDLFESVDASGKDNTGKERNFIVNQKNSSEYILQDETRNINIYDVGNKPLTYSFYDANNKEAQSFDSIEYVEYLSNGKKLQVVSNSKNQWNDVKAVTLMANLKDTYEFYDKVLANKGTNGKQNIINGFFNDSMPSAGSDNAYCWGYALYWQNEVVLSFGTDNNISIDTVGHEYTHGVERNISGMEYEGESGAIMEAYSDILGELVEDYSIDGVMDGDCDWIHGQRNMIDPTKNKYPSKYNGKYFCSTENKLDRYGNSKNDYGGVHTNNTVISHAAYLMYNGIDGTESMKLNTEMLSKIWFRSLLLLQTDSNFEQCANAVYKSAQSMKGITDEQLSCIVKAFEAVAINLVTDSSVTTAKGALLRIKDVNFKYYDNYHLRIVDLKDLRNPQIIVDTDIDSAEGYALDFEEGNYRIIVSDNDANGSNKEYYRTVHILDSGIRQFNVPVTIYTDFGGILAEDFTIPAENVITLGELSVIEPEITPADATSYSIKWSSSDESVATVSPNGEAGIITTLAKGTTTITAELTSGGKTITKTTNLRVASKARDTVLVLDVSGSMYGAPLEEMKKSAIQFCNDLLKDEYNNRVGIVFYDDAISTIDLTDDLDMLVSRIQSISDGGRTNMEDGLSAADKMLKNSGKADSIKNVVVMADGLPNEGKTSYSGSMPSGNYSGYYTSVSYANAVIDTAKNMMNNYNLYSLGFFHDLYSDEEKDFATVLMKELTNQADGYHQVDKAEDLQFAFGDISEDINVGSRIVINIACPVDVRVSYGEEMLSSSSSAFCNATSFGTLQLLGKNKDIKVVSLDSDKEYEVELVGTGVGKMDYSVNFFDEKEQLSDYRSFETVPITMTTVIKSNTDNSTDAIALNIDEDGDGEIDIIWTALAKSKGEITYEKNPPEPEEPKKAELPVKEKEDMPVWAIILICVFAFALVGGVVVLVLFGGKKTVNQNDNFLRIPVVEKVEESRENENQITEDAERSTGFIQVTNGSMNGFSVPIKDGETLYLGKDPKFANLVFTGDYKNVSRMHCTVTFDAKANRYYVTDSSSNGTYLISKKRLIKGKRTPVNINTVLILANDDCTVLLG